MTAWLLIPLQAGPHVLTRVLAGVDTDHLTTVGELALRPQEYEDLRNRLAAQPATGPVTP